MREMIKKMLGKVQMFYDQEYEENICGSWNWVGNCDAGDGLGDCEHSACFDPKRLKRFSSAVAVDDEQLRENPQDLNDFFLR
jgi:hypothetical protein